MSVPQRLRYNFITGTIQSLPAGGTTLTFPSNGALGPITITSGQNYMPLVVNPASYGNSASSEIVWVVSYAGGNTATVMRGQENSTVSGANWPVGTIFTHGTLVNDFGIVNQINNGDFPTPTASGQVLKATASGVFAPVWVSSSVPATAITSGALASGITISGSQVFGDLSSHASISGSVVYGFISATQISGGAVAASTTIPGSQVTGNIAAPQINGALNSATISGGQVTGFISATQISGGAVAASTTIPGSQVTGFISATQISGGALQGSVSISGSQVTGFISATQISGGAVQGSVTISGSQVTGNISASQISGGALQNTVTISGAQVNSKIYTITGGAGTLSDFNGIYLFTTVTGIATIPSGTGTPGQQVTIVNETGSANGVVISGASGVTVNSTTGSIPKLRANYSAATAICTASNAWIVVGDIA